MSKRENGNVAWGGLGDWLPGIMIALMAAAFGWAIYDDNTAPPKPPKVESQTAAYVMPPGMEHCKVHRLEPGTNDLSANVLTVVYCAGDTTVTHVPGKFPQTVTLKD